MKPKGNKKAKGKGKGKGKGKAGKAPLVLDGTPVENMTREEVGEKFSVLKIVMPIGNFAAKSH